MNLQDKNVVRTAADLEKKYNFAKLLGLSKNIETNTETLIKVENELNNMLNSLVINLSDVLDTQSSISLWFYEGIPTTSNEPYIDWATPSEHYGDLYYDQNSGYVYKYTSTGWVLQTDENLINALALTNVELDVTTDHERQVFFQQPTPPYQSGDWWIQEDGTLMICQLGKPTGETFEENDFVISTRYVQTVAVKQGDTIEVIKGQVVTITDTMVSYTDKATGKTTAISGDSITTGTLKSQNYVQGTSGTKFDLTNGVIDSKNFKLDNSGNIDVEGYITTSKGIITNLQYKGRSYNWLAEGNADSAEEYFLGYNESWEDYPPKNVANFFCASVYIPQGFTIQSAKIVVKHNPVNWGGNTGYCRNINAYNVTNYMGSSIYAEYASEYNLFPNIVFNNSNIISDAMGSGGHTFNAWSSETYTSNDISSVFKSGGNTIPGHYNIAIKTSNPTPGYYEGQDTDSYLGVHTGYVAMEINIIGYTKI